ncbi:MAG TPA: hypothetical protein VJZ03_04400, partial [Candidatus Bathyarchaeia archaeon]|nr:hypothetical protein [Candidatus Bathyarchaeia archaeon]
MAYRFFARSLILALMILPFVNLEKQSSSPQIGYNCCHFYDLDSGTPVFMLGEELWMRTGQDLTATLASPNGVAISKNLPADSAVRVYQFRRNDAVGTWKLNVHSTDTTRSISLHVLSDQLNASMKSLSYGLKNNQLLVDGTLTTQSRQQGGVLILAHKDGNYSLVSPPASFVEGILQTQITWDQANAQLITITINPSSLDKSYAARVWAEISAETSLIKQIGNGDVLVSLKQLVMRTRSSPMNISTQRKLTFDLQLPDLHTVGLDGQVPLRPGPNHLTTYVEIGTVIFSTTIDLFLGSNGIISSIASSSPILPIQSQTDFELNDDLRSVSEYKLMLIAKEFGVNALWNMSLLPPVTRIRLVNKLTQHQISDYEINSKQFQEYVRVGNDEYIIPTVKNQAVELNVSIGGIMLSSNEFTPQSTIPQPLSTLDILASASNVTVKIIDEFGNPAQSGTMRITRNFSSSNPESVDKTWTTENGIINLTLPLGEYALDLSTQGSTVTESLIIQSSTEHVDFTLHSLILETSRNE